MLRQCISLMLARTTVQRYCSTKRVVALPLRSKKQKSDKDKISHFIDMATVQTVGGKGGDGCISFLQLWVNDRAGPDGGDGGNGGHVIFEACYSVSGLSHVQSMIAADSGEKGYNRDCNGKNAPHTVIKVPVGTVIRDVNQNIVGDLKKTGSMFIAARGGAGGKGNNFFATDINKSPEIAEYGADGESINYTLELRSMAHFGLIGLPNAGKSTLLQAISRARPKIAPYPFTTLRPHLGIVQYSDYEQLIVADLPGLIEGSHKNRGLGISFLKHAERCTAMLIIVDVSDSECYSHIKMLRNELERFSQELAQRRQVIVANKVDLPDAMDNLNRLEEKVTGENVVAISAKYGTNITDLLDLLRTIYDEYISKEKEASINQ